MEAIADTRPTIDVVGLGPGGDEFVTNETRRLIASHEHRFLRTARHPNASIVGAATAFDDAYESASRFADVYTAIVEDLVAAAEAAGRILYAVPGSPLVLEATVRALRADSRVEVVLHPALGFLDLVWSRLGIDPVEAGVTLVDGHDFAVGAAGATGPLLVAHCHANWVLSEIKLAADDTGDGVNDDVEAVILHHLGLPDERIVRTTWAGIDRVIEADHLTSLYVPRLATPVGRELVAFHELARRLRRECPWDREQTHTTLTTYLLEETYEVVDAIMALDPADPSTDEHLAEELGDLLYQIEFHAAIAEQEGRFTMADVASGIREKLIRRHPHVFGSSSGSEPSAEDLVASWEEIKKAERVDRGPFDGVPSASGALSYASAILKRADRHGSPIPVSDVDLTTVVDMGEHLLAVVAECRRRGIDPEMALREIAMSRRRRIESEATGPGR